MDFHSLARRDLQALCKLNAIPANITNVAMADALKSLDIVEGLEDFLNRSPERKAVTAAKVPPRTGRRTSTQSKPIGDVSESVQPMTKSTRRTTRRAISDEIIQESKTPAIRSSRKMVEFAKTENEGTEDVEKKGVTENEGTEDVEKKGVTDTPALATYSQRSQVARKSSVKEVCTVQKVYSTRRSARLSENKDGEVKEEKTDSLVTELSRIDLEDGSDNKNSSGIDAEVVLQESVEKSDVVALETVNNLEGEALDAVQDNSTKSLVNEKQGDVQEEIVDALGEESKQLDESSFVADSEVINDEDNKGIDAEVVLQESVKKSDVVALETVNNLEGEALDAVQDNSNKSLVNEKQGVVQEEIVDALGEESKQLDESSFVADSEVINDEDNKVPGYPMDSENFHEQKKPDEAAPESGMEVEEDDAQEIVVDELKVKSEQCFDTLDESRFVHEVNANTVMIEDENCEGAGEESETNMNMESIVSTGGDSYMTYSDESKDDILDKNDPKEVEEDDAQEIVVDELKVKSEQCFDTFDESRVHEVNANSVMIEDEDCEVEKSLMGSDNPHEQLDLGAGEESETNMNMESIVSTGGDSYMTYSKESKDDILGNNDPKENADQTEDEMDSEKSFLDEVEPSIPDILNNDYPKEIPDILNNDYPKEITDILNNDYHKEIATGTEISSAAPFLSSGGAENKPVTKTPSVKGNSVSDDKENIDGNGMMFKPTAEEEAKKNKKNELNEKSLRELTKLLREKLQISNNTALEIGKVRKERPALQKLEDNCQR